MKKFSIRAVLALLGMLTLSHMATPVVSADEKVTVHILQGMNCKREAQVRQVFASISNTVSVEDAIAVQNRNGLNCAYNKKTWFMITKPILLGTIKSNGLNLFSYEATLIGLVRGNMRVRLSPSRTFFASEMKFPGTIKQLDL